MSTTASPTQGGTTFTDSKAADNQNANQKPVSPVIATAPAPAAKNNKKRNIALFVGVPVALLAGIFVYRHLQWSRWHVATDDAYLTSDVVQITPQVAGSITKLAVSDNQFVNKGQLIATLDPTTYQIALENARANLAVARAAENAALQNVRLTSRTGSSQIEQAQGGLQQEQSGVGQAQAQVGQADAGIGNAQANILAAQDNASVAKTVISTSIASRERARRTAKATQTQIATAKARQANATQGVQVAAANVRAAQASRAQAVQGVAAAQAQVQTARAGVRSAQAQIESAQAQLASAQAQVTSAQAQQERANREYTRATELFQGGAVPRSNIDTAQAAQLTAQAQLEQGRAQVQQVQASITAARQALEQAQSNVTARLADVGSAQNGVRAADAQIASTRAQVSQARTAIAESDAALQNAQAQYAAAQSAITEAETGIASNRARYSAANDAILQTRAALSQARASKSAAQENVGVARGKVAQSRGVLSQANTAPDQLAVAQANYKSAHAKVLQAQAMVHDAQTNLNRTRIIAPLAGTVLRRNGQAGQQVAIGQSLITIVPQNDVWIIANYKETQLGHVREGQKVDIEVDSLPDFKFTGHVQSLSAGTGSISALLPPENATGNFTKVVQRVPVKITFDREQKGLERLRAGLSAVPTIETEKH